MTLHDPRDVRRFRRRLLRWYRQTARDLPWRREPSVYRVWLSEVMLQQTQVATATPYFERFLAAFPTIEALAAASVDQVLRLWEGLGYYSRARSLHRAAQQVVDTGRWPRTADEWRTLPGVGRYTAAAIASITRNERVAVVDGNVKRVLARVLLIDDSIDAPGAQDRLWNEAQRLLTPSAPGDHNQALMELGARVCKPRNPQCLVCPVRDFCAAQAAGRQHALPVRTFKRAPRALRLAALVIRSDHQRLLRQRPPKGLLAGLWELPTVELPNDADARQSPARIAELARTQLGLSVRVAPSDVVVTHAFTHRAATMSVHDAELISLDAPLPEACRWVRPDELPQYALGKLHHKALAALAEAPSLRDLRSAGVRRRRSLAL